MSSLDLSQPEDQVRLRVGDYGDTPLLPTSVYTSTLADNGGSISKTVPVIATYILAIFAQRTRERLNYIEVYGSDVYKNYKDFLPNVIKNPRLAQSAPIPYAGGASRTEKNPLLQFTEDWNNAYIYPNQSEDLYNISNNDGVL